jgi:chlorite dismutase
MPIWKSTDMERNHLTVGEIKKMFRSMRNDTPVCFSLLALDMEQLKEVSNRVRKEAMITQSEKGIFFEIF